MEGMVLYIDKNSKTKAETGDWLDDTDFQDRFYGLENVISAN